MEHPVKEVPQVIRSLTEGSPAEQKQALETYFLPTAAFQHPFCRVSGFANVSVPLVGAVDSRWVILMIYRWYKILSPKIELQVLSVVHDKKQQVLYASIEQVFSLWFVPFYKSRVRLVCVLHLVQRSENYRYYIEKQEDLYQFNEFVKFVWPGGDLVLWVCQWIATFVCILGACMLVPLTWARQRVAEREKAM